MSLRNNSLFYNCNINESFAYKRKIRIKSTKLPADFFCQSQENRYIPTCISKKSTSDETHRDIQTPCFDSRRSSPFRKICNISVERKVETAREKVEK